MSENNVTTEKEIWKPVVGWEHAYSVSNLGIVRRGLAIKYLAKDKDGYLRVCLSSGGKVFRAGVHRVVCEAFNGPCPEGFQANHKNGIKSDNRATNLEWVTRAENMRHAVVDLKKHIGTRKFSDSQIRLMRKMWNEGNRISTIAKRLGASWAYVKLVVHRHKRIHVV